MNGIKTHDAKSTKNQKIKGKTEEKEKNGTNHKIFLKNT